MIAASLPVQRPADARLLVVHGRDAPREIPRGDFASLLRRGDLVVANDAATMPASLSGRHVASGAAIEVRLAAARSLDVGDDPRFAAIVFGAGDFHMRTEDRESPPALSVGDHLSLGPAEAIVERVFSHPRLIGIRFVGSREEVWAAIAHHGRPIQYAHDAGAARGLGRVDADCRCALRVRSAVGRIHARLARTRGAAPAGRRVRHDHARGGDLIDGRSIARRPPSVRRALIGIPEATSRGDPHASAKSEGGRVIAIGTTVVRALENSASRDGQVHGGDGVATIRIGPDTRLRIVDAILSGTHEPGTSHFELLRAFASDGALDRMAAVLEARRFRTHEFGDSVFVQ